LRVEVKAGASADKKVDAVRSQLRNLALKRGPSAKMPTVDEMCSMYHTSRATINDALETLESHNIIRRKRGLGIFVSDKLLQRNIAIVIGKSLLSVRDSSPFWDALWGDIIAETEVRTNNKNEAITVHVAREEPQAEHSLDRQLARAISSAQIDGVIAVGLDEGTWQWIKSYNVPVVSFASAGTWHVTLNSTELVRICTANLISQGCRKLRLWIPSFLTIPGLSTPIRSSPYPEFEEHAEAFRQTLASGGVQDLPDSIWLAEPHAEHRTAKRPDQGASMVARLVREGLAADTDGIISLDDMLTLGAYRAMLRSGIARYIRMASHANSRTFVLYAYEQEITQVLFDPATIATHLFEVLDLVLDNREVPEIARIVQPKLLTLAM
jgi:DNA-binding LacI/PurR family transcriptional regulator